MNYIELSIFIASISLLFCPLTNLCLNQTKNYIKILEHIHNSQNVYEQIIQFEENLNFDFEKLKILYGDRVEQKKCINDKDVVYCLSLTINNQKFVYYAGKEN